MQDFLLQKPKCFQLGENDNNNKVNKNKLAHKIHPQPSFARNQLIFQSYYFKIYKVTTTEIQPYSKYIYIKQQGWLLLLTIVISGRGGLGTKTDQGLN